MQVSNIRPGFQVSEPRTSFPVHTGVFNSVRLEVPRCPASVSHSLLQEQTESEQADAISTLRLSSSSNVKAISPVSAEHNFLLSVPPLPVQNNTHRPLVDEASWGPVKVQRFAHVLGLEPDYVQKVVTKHPQLKSLSIDELQALFTDIQKTLGFSPHEARLLITHHGDLLATSTPADLRARAKLLARQLRVSYEHVLEASGSVPSLLRRDIDELGTRLKAAAEALGGVSVHTALDMAAKAPQILTTSAPKLKKRVEQLSQVLGKPERFLVKALKAQPDILFLSPRILSNKVQVLQAILNRPQHLVSPVVLRCPKLLRTDLDRVRAAYSVLLPICGRNRDYTFAMIVHAPHLLLEHPEVLLGQARHVMQASQTCTSWREQLNTYSPAQIADLLGLTAPTYARLNYLVATQQAQTLDLYSALRMQPHEFIRRFPKAQAVKEARRRHVALAPVPRWSAQPWKTSAVVSRQSQQAGSNQHQIPGQALQSWRPGMSLMGPYRVSGLGLSERQSSQPQQPRHDVHVSGHHHRALEDSVKVQSPRMRSPKQRHVHGHSQSTAKHKQQIDYFDPVTGKEVLYTVRQHRQKVLLQRRRTMRKLGEQQQVPHLQRQQSHHHQWPEARLSGDGLVNGVPLPSTNHMEHQDRYTELHAPGRPDDVSVTQNHDLSVSAPGFVQHAIISPSEHVLPSHVQLNTDSSLKVYPSSLGLWQIHADGADETSSSAVQHTHVPHYVASLDHMTALPQSPGSDAPSGSERTADESGDDSLHVLSLTGTSARRSSNGRSRSTRSRRTSVQQQEALVHT